MNVKLLTKAEKYQIYFSSIAVKFSITKYLVPNAHPHMNYECIKKKCNFPHTHTVRYMVAHTRTLTIRNTAAAK